MRYVVVGIDFCVESCVVVPFVIFGSGITRTLMVMRFTSHSQSLSKVSVNCIRSNSQEIVRMCLPVNCNSGIPIKIKKTLIVRGV